jgi:uncharacterized membrane protein YfcA
MKKNIISSVGGFLAGILNGLLGAGGGMIIVPLLHKSGISTKKSHATSVAIIFSICLVSAFLYIKSGRVNFYDATPYLIWGVLGSILGTYLLTKINDIWLHRIFGCLMLWAAYRMLF